METFGGDYAPNQPILVTFQPTRFGNWLTKLSYDPNHGGFILVVFNLYNKDCMVRTFVDEMEVIKFVTFLGEKYE